jgi:heme exporter protein C
VPTHRIALLRAATIVGIPLFAMMIASLYLSFVYADIEKVMGVVQKIFYFHVSAWWNGFLGLLGSFIFSILYLLKRRRLWDIVASSSTEVSFIYLTIGITTGPIWAKRAWGVWWTWDPRLTTALVLWIIFAGYMLIRAASRDEERRGVLSALIAIFGFVDVPIVFMSIRWWRTIHPVVITSTSMGITPSMRVALFVSLGTFTLLFLYTIFYRMTLEMLRDDMNYLKERARGSLA